MERSDLFYYRENSPLMQRMIDFSNKHNLDWPLLGHVVPEAIARFLNQSVQNKLFLIQGKLDEQRDMESDAVAYLDMMTDFQEILKEDADDYSTLSALCHKTFVIGVGKLQEALFQNDENRFFAQLVRELHEAENFSQIIDLLEQKNHLIKSFVKRHIQALETQYSQQSLELSAGGVLQDDPTEFLREVRRSMKDRARSVLKTLKALKECVQIFLNTDLERQKISSSLSWIYNDDRRLRLTGLMNVLQEHQASYYQNPSPRLLQGLESLSRLSSQLHQKIREDLDAANFLEARLQQDPLKKVISAYLVELFNRMPQKFILHIEDFSSQQIAQWEKQPSSCILDEMAIIWKAAFQKVSRDVATIHDEFTSCFHSMRHYLLTHIRELQHSCDKDRLLLWNNTMKDECDRVFMESFSTYCHRDSRPSSAQRPLLDCGSTSLKPRTIEKTSGLPPLVFSHQANSSSASHTLQATQAPVVTVRKKFGAPFGSTIDWK